jgi:hypothetical protein
MSYYVTTFCSGSKYEPIKEKWEQRIKNTCKNSSVKILTENNIDLPKSYEYAWWDLVRLHNNLNIISETNKVVVNIDMDLIIEKDIEPLIDLDFDFIISTEIGNDNAFPKECSKILGFGICTGFYIIKPSAINFMKNIYESMKIQKYNTYSDQVNIMNFIVNNNNRIYNEEIILDNIKYTNKIIEIDNIKICVLDFNIIVRDPILNIGQFGNHINVDNVDGTENFLKYYDNDLESLPLTCRCGKIHLGDNTICKHIELRKK